MEKKNLRNSIAYFLPHVLSETVTILTVKDISDNLIIHSF